MSDIGDDTPREPWSYCGEVWTDDGGRAVVVLPPLVTVNRHGFVYELTPIGSSCSAAIVDEIVGNRFTIGTDEPLVKVAWRVTALRGRQPEREESKQ